MNRILFTVIYCKTVEFATVNLNYSNLLATLKCLTRSKVLKKLFFSLNIGFPVAQMVEHGARNAKIMGSIPRESKSW